MKTDVKPSDIDKVNFKIDSIEDNSTLLFENDLYLFHCENAIKRDLFISNTTDINPRSISMLLECKKNIVIDFNGATLLYHGQINPISVINCENVCIKNAVIDWNIPLNAEAVVINCSENYLDLRIDNIKHPFEITDDKLYFITDTSREKYNSATIFDGKTKAVKKDTADSFRTTAQEKISDNVIRFHGSYNRDYLGDIFVLRHSERIHPAIFIENSKNIKLENITIHNSAGLGVLSQFCENLTYDKINFVPNIANGRRVMSGHDDGLHFSNNKGDIVVRNCYFNGLMDDPINVHGTSVKLIKAEGNKVFGKFMHHQSTGFNLWAKPSDVISIMESSNLVSVKSASVKSYKLLSTTDFVVELDSNIELENNEYSMENLTNNPTFLCENNYFGPCRARGILISTTNKVIIRNNSFRTAGSAILIAGDANMWFESSYCTDVLIENNFFHACCNTSKYQFCKAVISVMPEIPTPTVPYHSNIVIRNNTFNSWNNTILYAFSAKNLSFTTNTIVRSYEFESAEEKIHYFEHCDNVVVKDNIFLGNF